MKYLVVYAHECGFGSVECDFRNDPPTLKDIRDAQEEIGKKMNMPTPVIINWLKIAD